KVIAVVVLYVLIQNLESYWVSPAVMAKQVALLPAVTLSAQVFFTTFFGIMGLILALPLTVVAKTWIQEALIKDVLDRCGTQRLMASPPPVPIAVAEVGDNVQPAVDPQATPNAERDGDQVP
ncbi:MAG: AI-2E family transporter, partial [Elainellaceae cyanobacterium]